MEVALRPVFSVSKAATANLRDVAIEGVLESLNVEDRWKRVLLSCSGTKEDSESLKRMVVEKYVDLRGHSFARSILELYKQAQKKTLQKNQGFRKNLNGKASVIPEPSNAED